MDIYKRKSSWKLYLAIGGVVIMCIVMVYTSYLANQLKQGERNKVELYVKALLDVADIEGNLDKDVTLSTEIIESNNSIPVIQVDDENQVLDWRNFPEGKTKDRIEVELQKIIKSGLEPVEFRGSNFLHFMYYKPSKLLRLLTYFPLIMLLMLTAFMGLGYLGLSTSRKAEQNRVWVGMAKETAHQLGTPISAIVAWIEHLRGSSEADEEKLEILDELTKDVDRLNLIADRFSKIGSAPELEKKNIFAELSKTKNYMQRRASRKVQFDFPDEANDPIYVKINSHLFNWVLENLVRNALDAMAGEGLIKAEVNEDAHYIGIDITDTGKGIPYNKQKVVFQPGYTTKKRGWGLGLSLAKRIIENYHEGKIYVKKSEQNVGTTFTIKLPKRVA